METNIFTWGDYRLRDDEGEEYAHEFTDIVLVRTIGQHAKGSRFATAVIDWQAGTLELYRTTVSDPEVYDLSLRVGEQL